MPKYEFNTTPERRLLMSKMRSNNTMPEIRLRKALWSIGLRYRINDKKLPGKPDIVLKKYKLVIFVDGEFWHGKDWEVNKFRIKSNRDFWIPKIEKNIFRDHAVNNELLSLNYTVFRFWSLEIKHNLGRCIKEILDYVNECDKF